MYPQPSGPKQPPAPARSSGRALGTVLLAGAGCALLIWLVAPHAPLSVNGSSVSLQQAHGLCNSGLGQFGQLLSPAIARDCGAVGMAYDVLALLFWGGLLMAAAGVFTLARRRQP